jgi:TonB-linked SusC/RagA family outer membrane protein
MRKFTIFLVFLIFAGIQGLYAQKVITGTVRFAEDNAPVPGATVLVKGTAVGTITDVNGLYKLTVPKDNHVILVSYVGMKTVEITLTDASVYDVSLSPGVTQLEGVVVTALGIPREKKSLGYATQELQGDEISKIPSNNFVNNLSGQVSGLTVTQTTNMGGSTNVILRGNKSISNDNQVLYVIDGVPVNNDISNTRSQQQAGQGFDYGNAASDINSSDIESINVLKGAAATALYGSRAGNGVIMITTKKGTQTGTKSNGVGVSLSYGMDIGFVDKKTFPEYQNQYGEGYGKYYQDPVIPYNPDDPSTWGYWYMRYINPDGTVTNSATDPNSIKTQWAPTSEDASYGAKFDPNLMVYQWDAVDKQSPNYHKATPWVAAKDGPVTFFENPTTYNTNVSIDKSFSTGTVRLSYTNYKQDGLMPNSSMTKNNVLLNGTWNITDKLTASGSANFSADKATGRNSTGYSDNILSSFRQWYATNVDMTAQKSAFFSTGRNMTWNWADPTAEVPIYWDNYYWTRYMNYESDGRNRIIGNVALDYKLFKWLDIYGRMSVDSYNQMQEERRAVGSIAAPFGINQGADGSLRRNDQGSGYLRRDITFSEYNWDLMANFNKDFGKDWNLKGVLGMNIRRTNYNRLISSTNGGLSVPDLYSLQNSEGPLPLPKELASKVGVNGIYLQASAGWKSLVYVDGSIRGDHSSTLPKDNATYYYPSIAGSFIFSNLIKENKYLSFGKIRLNYAEVGNSAPFDYLVNIYNIFTPLNYPMTSADGTFKNPDLKPERTRSLEGGLEMYFFGRRLGFDVALYKTSTINQILSVPVSIATGYTYKIVNAGEIQNKGVEVMLKGTAIKKKDFRWDITLNWALNRNKVISLYRDPVSGVEITNYQLGSFQGGVTINATVGQPYGTIQGTDYTYVEYNGNRERVINPANGRYVITASSNNVLGNSNPDWTGGLSNTLTYKNLALSFLIDCSMGGSIFSLDMYYGLATGIYKETAVNNDLGNPVRDPVVKNEDGTYASNSGGYINAGVNVIHNPDGSTTIQPNGTRISAANYGAFGYLRNPNKAFVYDATYVKLRNITLTYTLPSHLFKNIFLKGVAVSAVASNVWIIYKALPYADPESGLGAGNLQGYSIGSLPTTRNFGFNVKFNF